MAFCAVEQVSNKRDSNGREIIQKKPAKIPLKQETYESCEDGCCKNRYGEYGRWPKDKLAFCNSLHRTKYSHLSHAFASYSGVRVRITVIPKSLPSIVDTILLPFSISIFGPAERQYLRFHYPVQLSSTNDTGYLAYRRLDGPLHIHKQVNNK